MDGASKLAAVIAAGSNGNRLRLRRGVISSIQSYSVTLTLSGSSGTVAGVKYAASVIPRVGATVWTISDGVDLWVISQQAPVGVPSPTATLSATQAFTTGTEAAVSFNAAVNDGWTMWDSATKLIAKVPGTYMAIGQCAWANNATGYRQLSIDLNGTKIASQSANPVSGVDHYQTVTATAFTMAINDYVRLLGIQTSGGNLNTQGATPKLSLIYISPVG